MTRVVHCKKEPYDIYIGRPSKWGNPFVIGKDGNREEVIALFKEYITKGRGKHLLKELEELRGKTLGCFCKPSACHGDILLELLGEKNANKQKRSNE